MYCILRRAIRSHAGYAGTGNISDSKVAHEMHVALKSVNWYGPSKAAQYGPHTLSKQLEDIELDPVNTCTIVDCQRHGEGL